MNHKASWFAAAAVLKGWLNQVTEPQILFPGIGVLGLLAIWGMTLSLVDTERSVAQHAAALSGAELAQTYEAQVVRAMREIDQALKFVKYAYERKRKPAVLRS